MEEEKTITVTMTRRVTQAWKDSARENGAKAKPIVHSEEHRAKLRAAQTARRERERQAKDALGTPVVEKKANGRPKKEPAVVEGSTRKPGRPKKQTEGDASV